eukprot:jgi/Hompol1/1524/HPOL_002732-RA
MDKQKTPSWQALVAGGVAGAVEGFSTYPFEYVKTQLQLQSGVGAGGQRAGPKAFGMRQGGAVECVMQTLRTRGISGLYRGASPLVLGNACKAAAVLVVTPAETIKTKLIHDQARAIPQSAHTAALPKQAHQPHQVQAQYRGLTHAVTAIVREEGVAGLYRGLTAVVARQAANSAVRMTTYAFLKDNVVARYPLDPTTGKRYLPWYFAFANGAIAGIVTVYSTMPLDVLKTRMQALDAKARYRNSIDCLVKIVRHDGVLALWKGSTMRLGRLIFSGGIVFSVYEQCIRVFETLQL